ncbi:MAG TPA: hypothetical protein IGR64_12670 [Leptolyngbyaceae cyanobacterium M65_K2018_010]|nr:hypothetical protein [Leptolyngbyaceae cyanobacterium M65_K2018_010]
MPRSLRLLIRRRLFWLALLLLVWLFCSGEAQANSLGKGLERFPQWPAKLPLGTAQADLVPRANPQPVALYRYQLQRQVTHPVE